MGGHRKYPASLSIQGNKTTQLPYLSTRDLNCVICDTVPRKWDTLGQIIVF